MSRAWLAAMLLVACSLVACSPRGPGLTEGGVIKGGAPIVPEHTLSPGDTFELRFPFAPDHNDRVTVGMDGTVAPQAVGSVAVGGRTLPEATRILKQRYARLLRDPQLFLTMRRYAPELVYVDGWVNRPGLIRSQLPLTVVRAVTQAGGAKSGAITSGILVIRTDDTGKLHAFQAEIGNYGGAEAQDPLLKSFDIVYVPRSAIASVTSFLGEYGRSLPFAVSYRLPSTSPVTPPQVITRPAPTTTIVP